MRRSRQYNRFVESHSSCRFRKGGTVYFFVEHKFFQEFTNVRVSVLQSTLGRLRSSYPIFSIERNEKCGVGAAATDLIPSATLTPKTKYFLLSLTIYCVFFRARQVEFILNCFISISVKTPLIWLLTSDRRNVRNKSERPSVALVNIANTTFELVDPHFKC